MDEPSKYTEIFNKSQTFRFHPFDSSDKSKWCDVTATVKLVRYEDSSEYYHISYEYIFSNIFDFVKWESLRPDGFAGSAFLAQSV